MAYTTGPWEHEGSLDYTLSRDSQTTSANRLELEYSPSYHFDERLFALGLSASATAAGCVTSLSAS